MSGVGSVTGASSSVSSTGTGSSTSSSGGGSDVGMLQARLSALQAQRTALMVQSLESTMSDMKNISASFAKTNSYDSNSEENAPKTNSKEAVKAELAQIDNEIAAIQSEIAARQSTQSSGDTSGTDDTQNQSGNGNDPQSQFVQLQGQRQGLQGQAR